MGAGAAESKDEARVHPEFMQSNCQDVCIALRISWTIHLLWNSNEVVSNQTRKLNPIHNWA